MRESVRQSDLRLRAVYPHLETSIFKLNDIFYCILLKDFTGNFDDIVKNFDHNIKPIGIPVKLLKDKPEKVIEELPIIKDDEIGSNFSGLSLTLADINHLLIAKFPKVEIVHLETYDMERKMNVYTDNSLDDETKEIIINFLNTLDIQMEFHLIENKAEGMAKEEKKREERGKMLSSLDAIKPKARAFLDSLENQIMYSFPAKLNRKKIVFEERDEQMWFDKIGEIYSGNFTKQDIMNGINVSNSCYIDYTVFDNVNIRNGVVLYDRIFVEPPIEKNIKEFCFSQKVKSDEIIQLCKENKLAFILPQPGFRYDFDFFTELYNINPNCILSRRALSALIICDLVEINRNYFIKTLELSDSINEMTEVFKEIDKRCENFDIYSFFLWPQKALRTAFEVFLFGSTYKVAAFGVNNLFTVKLSDERKKEIELEFLINSNNVHLASALGSQYFPHFSGKEYSNQGVTSLMGNMLNLYKNSTTESLLSYLTGRQKLIENKPMLPVNLIEVNEYMNMTDLNSLSKRFFSPDNFGSILNYMLCLSPENMEKKIIEYNDLVEKEINRKRKLSSAVDLSVTATTDVIGLIPSMIPFVGTGLKILNMVGKKVDLRKAKKIEKIAKALNTIGDVYDEKKAISFLSRINSVARLRNSVASSRE